MSEERKHDGGTHDGGTIERLMATVDCIREIGPDEDRLAPSCHLCGAVMARVGVNEGVQAFKCLSCGATTGISIPTLRSASLAKDGAPAAAAVSPKLEAKTAAIGVGEGIGRGARLELPPPSEIYRQARAEGFTGEFYLSVCCGRELLSNSVTRFCPMCGRELRGDLYDPAELRSAIPAGAAGTTLPEQAAGTTPGASQ